MKAELPAPLVPGYVDLTDFPDMPLEVRRLRDSQLASEETDEIFRAALMIWAAAWHQIPAASVPNSDGWLAERTGFKSRSGIDPHWHEIRERVLRGFVQCSDGRLYHRVLAEKAVAAWGSKARHRYERMADRARKLNGTREKKGLPPIVIPRMSEWVAAGMPEPEAPEDIRQSSGGGSAGIPRNSGLKGREEKGSKEGAPTSSSLPPRVRASHTRARATGGDPAPKPKASRRCPADFAIDADFRTWAIENVPGVDLELELAAMKDHEFAKAYSDWPATFRNWLRTAFKRGTGRSPRAPGPASPPGRQTPAERRASTLAGLTQHRATKGNQHDDDPRPEPPDDIIEVPARRLD